MFYSNLVGPSREHGFEVRETGSGIDPEVAADDELRRNQVHLWKFGSCLAQGEAQLTHCRDVTGLIPSASCSFSLKPNFLILLGPCEFMIEGENGMSYICQDIK